MVTVRRRGSAGWQVLHSRREARGLQRRLKKHGFAAKASRLLWPDGVVGPRRVAGVRVRLDASYGERGDARDAADRLKADGFNAVVEWTGADPDSDATRTLAALLVVDPARANIGLRPDYGDVLAEASRVQDIASDAVAGVNGGFFVTKDSYGIPGTPAGIGVYEDGTVLSEATNGRAAVIVHEQRPTVQISRLSTKMSARTGKESREVDGVNRRPGLIRNCGGVGGDKPTEMPLHDVTCTDPDELVVFTEELGRPTPRSSGVELIVGSDTIVTEIREPGGAIPSGGYTIQGTGDAAEWLRANASVGAPFEMDIRITDAEGEDVELAPGTGVINGGPVLVRDGKVSIDLATEGLIREEDRSFPYVWAVKRHPRTAIGLDARGRILLLAVSGRQPGVSDGLGLHEVAEVLSTLGADRAVALDGGGSTTMVVEGDPVIVGDAREGQRKVADALTLVTP
ncbi:phosphodiester glycosidase family protein [Nocardiopsis rhodophaea]